MNKLFLLIFFSLYLCIPVFSLDYDYSSTKSIPIYVSITSEISTKKPIQEGQDIELRVLYNVYNDNKLIIRRNDIIKGKIKTIITSGMNGFPAEIILDDFEIPNISQKQLIGTYTKSGINRCFWVYPLKWAMTPLFPLGSFTNMIKGGQAKIKTTDIITIYYYPEWKE